MQEINKEIKIESTCRTCLHEFSNLNYLTQIQSGSQKTIAQILTSVVTELQLHLDDLPKKICNQCTENAVKAYNFKVQTEQNEKLLLNYLNCKRNLNCNTENDKAENIYSTQLNNEEKNKTIQSLVCDENIIDEIKIEGQNDESNSSNSVQCDAEPSFSDNLQSSPQIIQFEDKLIEKNDNKQIQRKRMECKICNSTFRKISKLRSHIDSHASLKSFANIDFQNNEMIKMLDATGATDIEKCIEFIIEQLKQGEYTRFYSITNKFGEELRLSDSETESDNDETVKELRYLCELCKEGFNRKFEIIKHQEEHHKEIDLPFTCDYCQKKFVCRKMHEYHLKIKCENYDAKFKCNQCEQNFVWHKNLIRHQQFWHPPISTKNKTKKRVTSEKNAKKAMHTCIICEKSFARHDHLERHSKIHKSGDKPLECPVCHKIFSRKDNLRSHLKTHDGNRQHLRKHLCAICGRQFSNSSNMIVHMRRHTGEKPYKCDVCDKGFPRSFDLNCHKRTHTGEKPCLCTICGKGFARSNKLRRHMRIHTGEKPYKCTYCDRAFTQSNDLTLHIRRHTGDKPYVCVVCGERFIQGTALYTHCRLKGHFDGTTKESSK